MGAAVQELLKSTPHPTQRELNTAAHADGEAYFNDGTEACVPDVPETDDDGAEAAPAGAYDDWQGQELRDECRRRDLPVSGTVAVLRERLTEDDDA